MPIVKAQESFFIKPTYVACFLCVCPNEIVIDFALQVAENYKVYIVCDNINCYTPPSDIITYIKLSDQECAKAGFTKSNHAIPKVPSAWDKALYYFCMIDKNPSYVWFIEEDVYIPRNTLLLDIDTTYPDADLIAKQNVKKEDDPGFGWWHEADDTTLEQPIYRSMVCATRLSRALLNKIVDFVRMNDHLIFIEILFNTIVSNEGMKLVMPEQLSTIIWRWDWTPEALDDNHMFHPIKDVSLHRDYRDRLDQKSDRKKLNKPGPNTL